VSARLVAAIVAGLLSLTGSAARGQLQPRVKTMWFAEKDGQLVVSVSFTELFDANAYRALADGTVTTLVLQAAVYPAAGDVPVAASMATFRVVYDLWDELYLVRIVDQRGERNWSFRARADAIKAVTEVAGLPVALLEDIPIGPQFRVELVAQLNPVASEELAEMRRWLTRRPGSARLESDSSFFGSFVSVFVNPQLRGADAALRLRSQPFYRVQR
jgi:hypothetical protein